MDRPVTEWGDLDPALVPAAVEGLFALVGEWGLGLRLVGSDERLQAAIRRELDTDRGGVGPEGRARRGGSGAGREARAVDLEAQRRKLLGLYYADRIGADLFAEEEARLRREIETVTRASLEAEAERQTASQLAQRFDRVAETLAVLDIVQAWAEATQEERRILVEELLEEIALFPDHLEVAVAGAPRLNVLLEEVGGQSVGVRGGT